MDSAVAVVSVSGAFNSNEQDSDVEMIKAVHEDTPAQTDVELTEGIYFFASRLDEECVVTLDLIGANVDFEHAKGKAFEIQKSSCDRKKAAEILARLDQAREVPHQHHALNVDQKNRIKNFYPS